MSTGIAHSQRYISRSYNFEQEYHIEALMPAVAVESPKANFSVVSGRQMYRFVPWEFAQPACLVPPNFTIIVDDDNRYPCYLIVAAAYCAEVFAHLRFGPRLSVSC
jgi:hypothetical protein